MIWNSGTFWTFKMYQLYMEDMKLFKKVAVQLNSLGPGSWEISYCLDNVETIPMSIGYS